MAAILKNGKIAISPQLLNYFNEIWHGDAPGTSDDVDH